MLSPIPSAFNVTRLISRSPTGDATLNSSYNLMDQYSLSLSFFPISLRRTLALADGLELLSSNPSPLALRA